MPRHQAFEFGDLPWVPARFKHYLTDALSIAGAVGERLGDAFCLEPLLDEIIAAMGDSPHIVDLCSGGAVPPLALRKRLAARGCEATLTLTDLRPNLAAFQRAADAHGCRFSAEPVDATAVPETLTGLRTIFNAFHHFPPDLARRILADAAGSRQPILIVEVPHRSVGVALLLAAFSVFTLALTPLIRPVTAGRLLWTYVIPVMPLMIGIDGVLSAIRAYDRSEWEALTAGLDDGYTWHIQRARGKGALVPATVVLGRPVSPQQR